MKRRKGECLFCKTSVPDMNQHKQECALWEKYRAAMARYAKILEPLIEANPESARITAADLAITINCTEPR